MKKAVIIILAVAILGAMVLYSNNKKSSNFHLTTPASSAASTQTNSSGSVTSASQNTPVTYKDGTYTGDATDTPYGTVQVAAVISGGKITDVKFLQMPSDQNHSVEVTTFSKPLLKQTAIDKQNASNIDFVSGATSTSFGFQQSLQAALDQAAQS